jgi:transposase
MASLIKKTIAGKPYYYARESKRVNGRPKIVWQKYLGRAEDIVGRYTDEQVSPKPAEAMVREFGAVMALYDLSERLDLVEHIDRHVAKRGSGPSVGTYLLVAILNRCLAPRSKAGIGEWFGATPLGRFLPIEAKQLTSQRYWDNMERIAPAAIAAIEHDIVAQMVQEFEIDLSRVLFDATNFFTFIDTFNARCELAQRGHSKEGRQALRIVGLALLVSADFHLPLLHHTYPGNQPDAPTFNSLTEALVARYRELAAGAEQVTLVFDKGNNSKDNLAAIEDSPYHFIGSLVPGRHAELLAVPAKRFCPLDEAGLAGVSAYRTRREVFGVERTVLVTYNENLFLAQCQTLLREIAKRRQRLRALQAQLKRWQRGGVRTGKAPGVEAVRKKVNGWMNARHMKQLFTVTVTERQGRAILRYRFEQRAWQRLKKTLLGKTLLFTDNDTWSDAEIVRGYRAQFHLEAAFRQMKDPHHIALRPQYHWTDHKIEVHVFCCVLALLLVSLLTRQMHRQGITLSSAALLDTLGQIRTVGLVYPPTGKARAPRLEMVLSSLSPLQRTLYETLGLARYFAS